MATNEKDTKVRTIAHKVKEMRFRRDISQLELAKRLGVKQSSIAQKELEKQTFSLELLMQICEVLHFDPVFIVKDINIDAADLELQTQTALKALLQKVQTLNEKQLNLVSTYIDSL